MTALPRVSILTPSYNQGRYLADTLASVRAQDYPNLEHIVVDGASTDDTLALLAGARGVEFVSEPDDGQASALNKAFEMSSGEIIGWLNSDDFYVTRDAVSRSVAALVDRGADVAYGHAIWVDDVRTVVKVHLRPAFSAARLRRFDFISQPATFFRRSAAPTPLVDAALGYALDYALWLEMAGAGRTFARVDEIVAAMRYHPIAKSVGSRGEMWAETDLVREQTAGSSVHSAGVVGDLFAMAALKVRGLTRFSRQGLAAERWCLPLTLPAWSRRPLFQVGIGGASGSAFLFPRYLAARRGRTGEPT